MADSASAGVRERAWLDKIDKDAEVPTAERLVIENGRIIEHHTDLPVCQACWQIVEECACTPVEGVSCPPA